MSAEDIRWAQQWWCEDNHECINHTKKMPLGNKQNRKLGTWLLLDPKTQNRAWLKGCSQIA